MFSIAHISDLHFPPMPKVQITDLVSKRILGYLSWHRKRKYRHRKEVLDALHSDLVRNKPDHICVTGDLTNISLKAEFETAACWLHNLAPADRISVIPGNHDAYVRGAFQKGAALWAKWMAGDDGSVTFPYLHRRDGVSIIGTSTAVATLPALASGRLGKKQIKDIEGLLQKEHSAGRFTVLLIHHPPVKGVETVRKGLTDQAAFRSMIARTGAGVILHGHSHKAMLHFIKGPEKSVPVLGAGSSSFIGTQKGQGHYFLIRIAAQSGGSAPQIEVEDRHFDAIKGQFIWGGHRQVMVS